MDKKAVIAIVVVVVVIAAAALILINHEDEKDDSNNNNNDPEPVTPVSDYYPVTFQDAIGQTVTLEKKPERIVALVSDLDLISWINVKYLDLVVGCPQSATDTSSASYIAPLIHDFSSVATLPASFYDATEEVIKLKPDIVMILVGNDAAIPNAQKFTTTMNAVGIQVFAMCTDSTKYSTIDGFLEANLLPACKIFNEEERGNALIAKCNTWVNDLYSRLNGITASEMKYVYVGGGSGNAGGMFLKSSWLTYYPTIYLQDYVYNIMHDFSDDRVYEMSFENFYDYEKNKHKIDAIIVTSNVYSNFVQLWKEDSSRFTAISAVQDGEVYGAPQTMARMCDGTVITIYAIAQYLYPDRFTDFNINDFALEVWKYFLDDEAGQKLYDARMNYYTTNLGMTGVFEKVNLSAL